MLYSMKSEHKAWDVLRNVVGIASESTRKAYAYKYTLLNKKRQL